MALQQSPFLLGLSDENRAPSPPPERFHTKILVAFAILEGIWLWVLPLGSSFWLDELITFWSAHKGVRLALTRSQFWPGQAMPYTVLSALAIRLGGTSEIVLRLPSLLAAVLTAWLLFRLAEHFFDKETGILVVIVFVSLREIAKEAATNARPYAIALLLVVACILQLVRWMHLGRPRNIVGFVLTAAAIPYFHYLFATVYFVLLHYVLYAWRSEDRARMKKLVGAAFVIAVLVSPLVWNFLYVHHTNSESSWAGSSDFLELWTSFIPDVLAASVFVALLCGYLMYRTIATSSAKIPRSAVSLFVSLLVIPIATLFLVARLSPLKIFVERYYLPSFAAIALLVGSGVRILAWPRLRLIVAGFIAFGSIMSYAGYHPFTSPQREDWRAAAEAVRAANISPNTPILLRVGIVESARAKWDLSNIDLESPLLCPLSKYPMPGRIVPLPYSLSSESIRYLEEISSQITDSADRFIMVERNDEGEFDAWMRGWFVSRGFEASELESSKGVSVFDFRRHHRVSGESLPERPRSSSSLLGPRVAARSSM